MGSRPCPQLGLVETGVPTLSAVAIAPPPAPSTKSLGTCSQLSSKPTGESLLLVPREELPLFTRVRISVILDKLCTS